MPTNHVETVETVSELPQPTPESRALVTGEKAVYVTEEVNGKLKWVLSVNLK
jgi:hypothetical protein